MKATFANLTASVLLATLILTSGAVLAEGFDIRLQSQRALEEIARDQRADLRDEAVWVLKSQAREVAGMDPPWSTGYLSRRDVESSPAPATPPAPLQAAASQTEKPRRAPRANKFGLPYFSFGSLMSSRKDN